MEQENKKRNSSTDGWIKCQSKTRAGKSYYFNKINGETRWTAPDHYKDNPEAGKPSSSGLSSSKKNNDESKKPEIAPMGAITKSMRNPAQDRLKRLQHTLKVEQKTKDKSKLVEQNNNVERDNSNVKKYVSQKETRTDVTSKDQQTSQKESTTNAEASTSKAAISRNREILTAKRKLYTSSIKSSTSSPNMRQILKRRSPIELPKKVATPTKETNLSPPKRARLTENRTSHSSTPSITRATTTLGSAIVNKITSFFQTTLNSYKNAKQATSENVAATRPVDIISKAKTTTSAAHTQALDVKATLKPCSSASATLPSISRNLVIPTYEKGGANTRLERLRLSLFKQATSSTMFKATTSSLCASASSPALACVIANNDSTHIKKSIDEPMDWATTETYNNPIEISSSSSSTSAKNLFNRNQSKNTDNVSDKQSVSSGDGTIGEYYDRVNENLLRFAAEEQCDAKASAKKWLTDCYYFVADTNVMLEHSQFIGDVMRMHLCGTTGTIIYIPYCVLQELDKLKIRGRSEGVKTLAIFAIKFLNAHFEAKNRHIQAQSAFEEHNHIIDVYSPDDSIINCCLQVKQHVEHVILLTEDINLRNKAICNSILVSTKSDLTSRHPPNKQLLK